MKYECWIQWYVDDGKIRTGSIEPSWVLIDEEIVYLRRQ